MTQHPSIFNRYPKTALGVIVFVFAVMLDFGLTAIYHVLKYETVHHRVPRPSDIRSHSFVFSHTFKPNASSVNEGWGSLHPTVFTNSMGFRDKTIREVPLKSDHYRVLFIGDSFTEGVGYDFQQTFVGIIAEALSPQGIEVLNAGVVGYSPAIYFKKAEYILETIGLQFDQMVLFLDISDIADEVKSYEIRDGKTILTPKVNLAAEDFINAYSTILRNLVKLAVNIRKRISDHEYRNVQPIPRTPEDERYGIKHDRSMWTIDRAIFEAYGQRGLVRAQLHMGLLYDLLARHHIGLTVCVYPWPDQIFHHDLDSLQVRFWRGWASKHSVKFINLFPEFIKDGRNPKEVIAQYYIPGDTHWNDRGHQLVARRILEELQPTIKSKHALSMVR